MNKKNRFGISAVIIIMGLLCLAGFCKKEEDEDTPGGITDKDGNSYTSVTIGTQVWMVENLKTTKYNDGSPIPNVMDNTAWLQLTTDAYSWYDNDVSNKTPYGALYNWYAVNTGKLCPSGWHVPSDAEWITLKSYLGGEDVAGGKLKEAGTNHWDSPNTGATNDSGFSALAAGKRDYYIGDFKEMGTTTMFWSATEGDWNGELIAYTVNLRNTGNKFYTSEMTFPIYGLSVRCLKN